MNKADRAELVLSMERIARCINDESIFEAWLVLGVADGDGDMETISGDDFYTSDDEFAYLMHLFLDLMTQANKSGGLTCDGIADKAGRKPASRAEALEILEKLSARYLKEE